MQTFQMACTVAQNGHDLPNFLFTKHLYTLRLMLQLFRYVATSDASGFFSSTRGSSNVANIWRQYVWSRSGIKFTI